jgi:hypothetical protein
MDRLSEMKVDGEKDYLELKTCAQLHQRISGFVNKINKQFSAMLSKRFSTRHFFALMPSAYLRFVFVDLLENLRLGFSTL